MSATAFTEETLREVFLRLDTSGDGFLSYSELFDGLSGSGLDWNASYDTREMLDRLWKRADRDGNGIADKDGVELEIEFLYPSGNDASKLFGIALRSAVEELGIKINLASLEWATFLEAYPRGMGKRAAVKLTEFDRFCESALAQLGLHAFLVYVHTPVVRRSKMHRIIVQ